MHLRDDDPLFIQPKNSMPRINEVWAYVSVDKRDGNEGVLAVELSGAVVPMIAADRMRLTMLRPWAESMAKISKMKVRLVKFTTREEVEEFNYEEATDRKS